MTSKGIDCATPLSSKTAPAIVAAGYGWAARYLVPIAYAHKRLTRAEALAITSAGMKIISVFETTANRPQGGANNGKKDGASAYLEARNIQQPLGSAIYFAVDYDAQPKDYDLIEAYLRAAAQEIPGYQVGVYGSYAVVEAMAARGAAKVFWQTYAWSKGKKSSNANLYQWKNGQTLAGVGVDFNESYGGEGWWDTKPIETPQPASSELVAKVVRMIDNSLITTGKIVDGRIEAPIAEVLDVLGVKYTYDNNTKKLYI
ncbi:protein of unknown function [Cohnella sp. OV330]|uniref:DUF1906 domain-containing protein n=1 Tax=Cohnella sp. OV330 TaxID=1855288 RepID=UPI0008EE68B3|nr:DUF1906 domain-containing protein [Cohnella sp. OV330]SFA91329.1 protein of unknown function [Cohnella sp. OV330]